MRWVLAAARRKRPARVLSAGDDYPYFAKSDKGIAVSICGQSAAGQIVAVG
jgi:hypothetical protein